MFLTPIKSAYAETKPGQYPCTFTGIEEKVTSRGKALRWTFKDENGNTISDLSDANAPPTPKNKTGTWLVALTGQQLTPDKPINTDDYVGKKYLVIVGPKPKSEKGAIGILMFTKITGMA